MTKKNTKYIRKSYSLTTESISNLNLLDSVLGNIGHSAIIRMLIRKEARIYVPPLQINMDEIPDNLKDVYQRMKDRIEGDA